LEPDKLIQDLIQVCRDLLLFKTAPHLEQWQSEEGFLASHADHWTISQLSEVLNQLVKTEQQMKWVTHPKILLEMLIVRLCESKIVESKTASSNQLEKLEQRIQWLEKELSRLKSEELVKSDSQPSQIQPSPRLKRQSVASARITLSQEPLSRSFTSHLEQVKRSWPEILQRVKEENIMIHAWFRDGEPVATTEESVIVAFRSKIHRETTEKESHKSLIEQTLFQIFGKPIKLKTVMMDEWKEWLSHRKGESLSEQSTEVEESPNIENAKEVQGETIYQKAVQLFGEELVQLVDSEKYQGG
jgi:DNA polymerase-3 subunit gamma/tau